MPQDDSAKESVKCKNNIKKVIAVMSGKGGVGKSTISVMIAKGLNKKGFKVGILDADITGPSIPNLLNLDDKLAMAVNETIIPVVTKDGIKVMSLNLLIENKNEPVIWRGPVISSAVKQFWTDVDWGDLDYLVIDMPPGTGDVALTVMQSIPIDGIVMVSIPQDLVSMIVSKAVIMAKKMGNDILGVVENMSYIVCPDCGKKIKIFGKENTDKFLKDMGLKLLGELPMSNSISNISDSDKNNASIEVFDPIVENILKELNSGN